MILKSVYTKDVQKYISHIQGLPFEQQNFLCKLIKDGWYVSDYDDLELIKLKEAYKIEPSNIKAAVFLIKNNIDVEAVLGKGFEPKTAFELAYLYSRGYDFTEFRNIGAFWFNAFSIYIEDIKELRLKVDDFKIFFDEISKVNFAKNGVSDSVATELLNIYVKDANNFSNTIKLIPNCRFLTYKSIRMCYELAKNDISIRRRNFDYEDEFINFCKNKLNKK